MSGERVVVAIIKPAPGKKDRVIELLRHMTRSVHANEPGALRYHLHSQIESDDENLVMIETYKTKDDHETHRNTDDFKNLFKVMTDEQLVGATPQIITCTSVAGFEDRNEQLRT